MRGLPALVCVALFLLFTVRCRAGVHRGFGGGGFHGHFAQERGPRPQPQREMNRPEPMRPQFNPRRMEHEDGLGRPESQTKFHRLYGHGQEHMPEWWAAHRNLSPSQQDQAMRRQPGFQKLPRQQQQMLLNRLRHFDHYSPAQQERMLNRMEMFERLSPERQQEVRGAAQAYRHMDPAEKQRMRTAFHQLRMMPPAERDQMLHSAYGQQFSPQERTVLGNMLSIEPYQPQQQQPVPPTPYFGRR